ncbi:MAG TPA: hypothetical protein PK095_05125 [Myxococcota bacterium]|nr:hypothetical protein [Myxococcota bacterium]
MNIIDEIVGFFTRLFRQKVNSVEAQAKARVMSAQVRAQSKAANSINQKLKQGAEAAKSKVVKPPEKKK